MRVVYKSATNASRCACAVSEHVTGTALGPADLALLTPAERRLVRAVASEPGLDGSALAARSGIRGGDLELLLDRLEALGAVARDGDATRLGSELLRRHLLAS